MCQHQNTGEIPEQDLYNWPGPFYYVRRARREADPSPIRCRDCQLPNDDDHAASHPFRPDYEDDLDFINGNWEHAVCLDCGAIVSTCDHCGAAYDVTRSESWGGNYHSSNGVPICRACLHCERCCEHPGKDYALTRDDESAAIEEFIRFERFNYPREPKRPEVARFNLFKAAGRASRYTAESVIVEASDDAAAVADLLSKVPPGGGGRRGNSIHWQPQPWDNYHLRFRHGDLTPDDPRNRRKKAPAGLWVETEGHRCGLIPPLTIVRYVRSRPQVAMLCTACGIRFSTAFPSDRRSCPNFQCHEVAREIHGATWRDGVRGWTLPDGSSMGALVCIPDPEPDRETPGVSAPAPEEPRLSASGPQLGLW